MNVEEKPSKGAPAVSVILTRGGKHLLVRRRNPPAQDLFAFPGGRVEPGESLERAALRELKEETGIEAINPLPLTTFDLRTSNADGTTASHFFLTVFTADYAGGEAVAQDDAAEAGWYTPDEIRSLPVPESVLSCLHLLESQT